MGDRVTGRERRNKMKNNFVKMKEVVRKEVARTHSLLNLFGKDWTGIICFDKYLFQCFLVCWAVLELISTLNNCSKSVWWQNVGDGFFLQPEQEEMRLNSQP